MVQSTILAVTRCPGLIWFFGDPDFLPHIQLAVGLDTVYFCQVGGEVFPAVIDA